VALPGGVGTLEEVVEQLAWAQLGRHRKPILIANIAGYWDPLLVMFDPPLSLGFLTNGRLGHLVADHVDDILPTLLAAAAKVSEVEKLGEPERVERL
jgi:predicted Rossmann-fold nucleotide-binding protein